MSDLTNGQYQQLIKSIGDCLANGQQSAVQQVNRTLVETYWNIGRYIVEFEQQGQEKAEYGSRLLARLSKDLKQQHGKGFSKSNAHYMRLFYLRYPIFQTLSGKLSWSHYTELLAISDDLARSFYAQQCIRENWSVRELKRQKNSALFERVALSRDKGEILALSQQGQMPTEARDVVKDPYVFEFLKLPEQNYRESELENQLIAKLEQFLLELGKGFAFIGQQYRITLNNTHFYVDLVFYHRILKCFVLIDLKTRSVSHQDIGQMNMYLNYFKAEENVEDDNDPIGIVLATDRDEIMVEYAMGSISNQLFVSRYQLYLPDVEVLKAELRRLLESGDKRKN
ncbi:MAG: PDDEXK nuclease domain-containing protein [Cyanobacteria bacterium P01_F01_bin.150]